MMNFFVLRPTRLLLIVFFCFVSVEVTLSTSYTQNGQDYNVIPTDEADTTFEYEIYDRLLQDATDVPTPTPSDAQTLVNTGSVPTSVSTEQPTTTNPPTLTLVPTVEGGLPKDVCFLCSNNADLRVDRTLDESVQIGGYLASCEKLEKSALKGYFPAEECQKFVDIIETSGACTCIEKTIVEVDAPMSTSSKAPALAPVEAPVEVPVAAPVEAPTSFATRLVCSGYLLYCFVLVLSTRIAW